MNAQPSYDGVRLYDMIIR